MAFSNALREQCRVVKNLEYWTSGIRQMERNLRTARYSNKLQAMSLACRCIPHPWWAKVNA